MRGIILVLALTVMGCSSAPPTWSARQPAAVASADTIDQPEEYQETGTLTAKQYQMLVAQAIAALSKSCKINKNAPVAISSFVNMSPLDLDIQLLTRSLQDALFDDHWKLTDISARPEVFSEFQYEQSDMVNPTTAIQKGKQLGLAYVFRPAISAQSTSNDKEKMTRISLRLQAVNTETAQIQCNAVGSIVQRYERQRTGF